MSIEFSEKSKYQNKKQRSGSKGIPKAALPKTLALSIQLYTAFTRMSILKKKKQI